MKAFLGYLSLLFSSFALAEIAVQPVFLEKQGEIVQLAVDDQQQLLMINKKGDLWKLGDEQPILSGLSPYIQPQAGYGKTAVADNKGRFLLLENGRLYSSDILLSPNSGMAILPFAVIAVANEKGESRLVRIETDAQKAKVVAYSAMPVLSDARPVQVNFNGDNRQGHIAVLAQPDNITYRHGVLGDDVEAAELQFLERHNLQPLATALSQQGAVFEANSLAVFPTEKGNKIVTLMSGNGEGAKTVMVGVQNNKLVIERQTQALNQNRWQSPFVFNGKLYAVQMPHLVGRLVEYEFNGTDVKEKIIADGLSNHQIGSRETDLTAVTAEFVVIPQMGYRTLSLLNKQGKLTALSTQLPAKIVKTVATDKNAYLLLHNGEVWSVGEEK